MNKSICLKKVRITIKLQSEINQLHEDEARGAFVRSRGKWLEKGEKKFKRKKSNTELSSFLKLKIYVWISKNANDISDFVKTFYEEPYTKKTDTSDFFFLP